MSSIESPDALLGQMAAIVPPSGPSRDGGTLRTVALPGMSLIVRSWTPRVADAPPAFFLHGFGGSSENWSALMGRLADVVSGEAVDLPGFGYSPPPDDGNYSIGGQARSVVRLLEATGRKPVHLFGNSLGGAIATRIAATRPELVRTLTLISPALPEIPPPRGAWPTALASVPGLPRLYMRATGDWTAERRTRKLIELCYGHPEDFTRGELMAAALEYDRRLALPYFWDVVVRSSRGLVNAYTLGGQHSLWRQAQGVLAPTLLVYGKRDKLVTFRMARRAVRAFRDARLLAIPEGGHVSMMEHPDLVARAFRELLDDAVARPPGTV